jgi:hypothetical protein
MGEIQLANQIVREIHLNRGVETNLNPWLEMEAIFRDLSRSPMHQPRRETREEPSAV